MKTETECERVLAYMSGRYEDSFTCPVYYGGYPGISFHQYYLNAENLDGAEVMVEVCGGGTQKERYLDNYMGVKYKAQLKDVLEDVLVSARLAGREDLCLMLGSDKLGISDHWTLETGPEEYRMDPAAGISFTAVIGSEENFMDPSRRKAAAERLENALIQRRICCTGRIYFVRKDQVRKEMNEVTFFDLILKHSDYTARLFFNMKTAEGMDEVTWDGGKMEIDGPEVCRTDPLRTAAEGDD